MQQTLLDLLNSRQSKTSFVFGFFSLNCQLRLVSIFSETFSKNEMANGFFLLLPASRTCSMPQQGSFVPYLCQIT